MVLNITRHSARTQATGPSPEVQGHEVGVGVGERGGGGGGLGGGVLAACAAAMGHAMGDDGR
jgi:hypothetical protein